MPATARRRVLIFSEDVAEIVAASGRRAELAETKKGWTLDVIA